MCDFKGIRPDFICMKMKLMKNKKKLSVCIANIFMKGISKRIFGLEFARVTKKNVRIYSSLFHVNSIWL